MKKFKDISLDLETMDNSSNSAIISIGACYFDRYTGEIGETFHQKVNLQSCIDAGLTVSASTIMWWLQQSDEAREKLQGNDKERNLSGVLSNLKHFMQDCEMVWGNGATFDNTILENAFKSIGHIAPWKFWNARDLRTLVDVGLELGVDPKNELDFNGVRHDALADAIHQAKIATEIYREIRALLPQPAVVVGEE